MNVGSKLRELSYISGFHSHRNNESVTSVTFVMTIIPYSYVKDKEIIQPFRCSRLTPGYESKSPLHYDRNS